LPLLTWFTAIRAYAANSRISPRRLCELTGVRRRATAAAMIQRMRQALQGDDALRQFAGLLPGQPRPRKTSAKRTTLQNKAAAGSDP
jgi:hypothetical protein